MPRRAVTVRGYREFMRAVRRAPKDARKEIRAALVEMGEPVRQEAAQRFTTYDERSAAGYRVAVRQRGVSVVQSLRKTTGKRPDYGALQMRKALLAALYDKQDETVKAAERALDRIADHFDH